MLNLIHNPVSSTASSDRDLLLRSLMLGLRLIFYSVDQSDVEFSRLLISNSPILMCFVEAENSCDAVDIERPFVSLYVLLYG